MATEYIVTDRTTALNQSIQIDDGQIKITDTVSAASAEPIVQDNTNGSIYWKIFVDDGQIGVESTLTVQDDAVVLVDLTTATSYILFVSDGEFGYETYVVPGSLIPRLTLLGVG